MKIYLWENIKMLKLLNTKLGTQKTRGSYRKSWATIFFMRTGNSRRRRV